jgi:LSD1 subclass zinc finger protein
VTATCPSCGCHQPNGLLCWQDTEALLTMFAAIPALVDELQVAISKQAKISNSGKAGKGSAHTKSPVNFGALAVRDALMVELALWGDDIDEIRRHPQAAEIVSGIGRAVKDAYRCIDRMADRKYLGQCLATEDGATCHAELWVKPGAHQVRCSQCETVHDVPELREKRLVEAEDLIVTPREASSYIGEVGHISVGQQRIRNYLDRGRITKRPSSDGLLRFRLGDLLDVLRDDAARHDARAS